MSDDRMTALDVFHEHTETCDRPCQRCCHLACEHAAWLRADTLDDCTRPGCDCPAWLAYGDCPGEDEAGGYCNGTGGWWDTSSYDGRGGDWVVCPLCGGNGIYYSHEPQTDAS